MTMYKNLSHKEKKIYESSIAAAKDMYKRTSLALAARHFNVSPETLYKCITGMDVTVKTMKKVIYHNKGGMGNGTE